MGSYHVTSMESMDKTTQVAACEETLVTISFDFVQLGTQPRILLALGAAAIQHRENHAFRRNFAKKRVHISQILIGKSQV